MTTMTKFKHFSTRSIPQWQSNRMKQIIIDRWQETWAVVEARNKTRKALSSR